MEVIDPYDLFYHTLNIEDLEPVTIKIELDNVEDEDDKWIIIPYVDTIDCEINSGVVYFYNNYKELIRALDLRSMDIKGLYIELFKPFEVELDI